MSPVTYTTYMSYCLRFLDNLRFTTRIVSALVGHGDVAEWLKAAVC